MGGEQIAKPELLMLPLLLVLLASPAVSTNVDVQAAFSRYCHDFCGSGGVANCDIGSGQIQETYPLLVENGRSESGMGDPIPATDADRNTSTGINCDEKTGNTCQMYGNDWGWCNYPQYRCMTKYVHAVTDKKYSNIVKKDEPHAEGFIFTHWIDNNSTLEQSSTVEFDESTTAEATMTLSATVSAGVEISIKAGVPDILETTIKESFSMSATSTRSKKLSKTQHWTISQPIKAPPRSTIKAELVIGQVRVSGDWTAQVKFPYTGKLWCNQQVNGHYEWFVPASNFLPKYHTHHCSGDTCKVVAKFAGWHGVDSQVKLTQCKLGSRNCGSSRQRRPVDFIV